EASVMEADDTLTISNCSGRRDTIPAVPADSAPAAIHITDDRACSRQCVLLLLLILAVGAALRCYAVARASLSTDELFTLWISTGRGLDAIPRNVLLTHPPDITGYDDAPPWWHVF